MKNSLLILFIILSLAATAQENSSNNNRTTIIGKIDNRDRECTIDIERAKLDFKTKEVYYYIRPDGYLLENSRRSDPFITELLKKKGIQFLESPEIEFPYSITDGKTTYQHVSNCYYKASNELLNLKYGNHFTEDIEKTADSLYVMNRINDAFEYPFDVDAYCIIYPKAKEWIDQKNEIKNDFFSTFKFPNDFISNENNSDFFAKAKFIINRTNKVSDITIKIEFKNPKNEKFKDYIINRLTTFIENANWQAAVSSGIKVNSRFEMVFYN